MGNALMEPATLVKERMVKEPSTATLPLRDVRAKEPRTRVKVPSIAFNNLYSTLKKCQQIDLTGRLNVEVENSAGWGLYFYRGSIIWADGGLHPVRRWLRQLKRANCSVTVPSGLTGQELLSSPDECWDYLALAILAHEHDLQQEQVKLIVKGVVHEVLFEIAQAVSSHSPEKIKSLIQPGIVPCNQELLLPIAEKIWFDASNQENTLKRVWRNWDTLDLREYAPNLGITCHQEKFREQKYAQFFLKMEREEKTLHDLVGSNQSSNLLGILREYLTRKLIRFQSVPDLLLLTLA